MTSLTLMLQVPQLPQLQRRSRSHSCSTLQKRLRRAVSWALRRCH